MIFPFSLEILRTKRSNPLCALQFTSKRKTFRRNKRHTELLTQFWVIKPKVEKSAINTCSKYFDKFKIVFFMWRL